MPKKNDQRTVEYEVRSGLVEEVLLAGILADEMHQCMKTMVFALGNGNTGIALLCARGALQARQVAIYYGVWNLIKQDDMPWDEIMMMVDAAMAENWEG